MRQLHVAGDGVQGYDHATRGHYSKIQQRGPAPVVRKKADLGSVGDAHFGEPVLYLMGCLTEVGVGETGGCFRCDQPDVIRASSTKCVDVLPDGVHQSRPYFAIYAPNKSSSVGLSSAKVVTRWVMLMK